MVRIESGPFCCLDGERDHLSLCTIHSPSSPGIWALPVNRTHLGAAISQLTRYLHGERGLWHPQTGQQSRLPSTSRLLEQAAASLGSELMFCALRDQGPYLNSVRGVSSGSQSRAYNEQVSTSHPRLSRTAWLPASDGFLLT